MNENPILNPNSNNITLRQVDDALRTVAFEIDRDRRRRAQFVARHWPFDRKSTLAAHNIACCGDHRQIALLSCLNAAGLENAQAN